MLSITAPSAVSSQSLDLSYYSLVVSSILASCILLIVIVWLARRVARKWVVVCLVLSYCSWACIGWCILCADSLASQRAQRRAAVSAISDGATYTVRIGVQTDKGRFLPYQEFVNVQEPNSRPIRIYAEYLPVWNLHIGVVLIPALMASVSALCWLVVPRRRVATIRATASSVASLRSEPALSPD